MAVADESRGEAADGDEAARGDRAERKAARKLRKAEDVVREAPLAVQSSTEREGRRQAREKRQEMGPAAAAARGEPSPEELELRRSYAVRIRTARAAAGGGAPDGSGAVTVSAEEVQLRREYGTKLKALRAGGTAALTGIVSPASTLASPEPVQQVVAAAAPRAAPMTPEERKAAKHKHKAAKQESTAAPLPDSWRPPVASSLAGGPAFVGSETAPLAAPVLRQRPPSPWRKACDWLAPRPGARGAVAGAAMFLFWELCRVVGGGLPGAAGLFVDLLIAGVIGGIAWRLLLAREMRHA